MYEYISSASITFFFLVYKKNNLGFFKKKARFLLFAKTTPWGRTLEKRSLDVLM